jgi:restriction system protein
MRSAVALLVAEPAGSGLLTQRPGLDDKPLLRSPPGQERDMFVHMVAEVALRDSQADQSALRVPTYDRLMWPTLKALRAMGGSATNEELLSKIIEQEAILPEIAAVQHVDQRQTRLGYNLAWAKTYLKKVGALENSGRGVWALTKIGEALKEADIAAIPSRVRKQDADIRRMRDRDSEGDPGPAESGDAEAALEPFWKDELLATLRDMTATAFERLAQRLLREAGFIKVEVTGRSGDGGIDGIGVLRLTLLSFQVLFQCKRYQGSVGASAIRDFRGGAQRQRINNHDRHVYE